MKDERPLHVRCAEALGWWDLEYRRGGIMSPDPRDLLHWFGRPPEPPIIGSERVQLPPFGENTPEGWACTGPIQQDWKLCLDLCEDMQGRDSWMAAVDSDKAGWGHTTTEAIADWAARYAHEYKKEAIR